MNFESLLQERGQKLKQKNLRQKYISKEIQKTRLAKISSEDTRKKGKVQKTKLIKKKVYQTYVEKTKQVKRGLSQTVTANTYINITEKYLKILQRTRQYITFNNQPITMACDALQAFGNHSKQKILYINLTMQKQISATTNPFQIQLPHEQKYEKFILISPINETEKSKIYKNIKQNLEIISLNDFSHRLHNKDNKDNKKFQKQIKNQQIALFVEFQLFKDRYHNFCKFFNQGIVIFPIDGKKIPYVLRDRINSFEQYFQGLQRYYYVLVKSGRQHSLKLNLKQANIEDIKELILRYVAKLIEKNNNCQKGNSLIKAQLKTLTSIPIEIYNSPLPLSKLT